MKYFDFEDVHQSYSGGLLSVKLRGTYKLDVNSADVVISEKSSPYDIFVTFSIEKSIAKQCAVTLRSVRMTSQSDGNVAFSSENSSKQGYQFAESNDKKSEDELFYFKDVPLAFSNYYLDVDFTLPNDCVNKLQEIKNGHAKFLIKTTYHEEKLSDWKNFLRN